MIDGQRYVKYSLSAYLGTYTEYCPGLRHGWKLPPSSRHGRDEDITPIIYVSNQVTRRVEGR